MPLRRWEIGKGERLLIYLVCSFNLKLQKSEVSKTLKRSIGKLEADRIKGEEQEEEAAKVEEGMQARPCLFRYRRKIKKAEPPNVDSSHNLIKYWVDACGAACMMVSVRGFTALARACRTLGRI